MGVIAKAVAQSASPMLLRQAIGLHSTADINLFSVDYDAAGHYFRDVSASLVSTSVGRRFLATGAC